jgi:YVTN family beta-propeller protein
VANHDSGTVSVVDTTNNQIVTTIAVDPSPTGIAINPTTRRVFVACAGGGCVSVIDTALNAVVGKVYVGGNPEGVAVDPALSSVYVTSTHDGTGAGVLSVIQDTVVIRKGDLNGDGAVNVADALVGLQVTLGLRKADSNILATGDLNGDGRVNLADVLIVMRLALGM